MSQKKIIPFCISILFTQLSINAYCQYTGQTNPITTAVPFLTISPDARSGALGDAGVAISPDANSTYWNPAKLPFNDKKVGASLSYTPWLHNLVSDMSISYLSGYYKVKPTQALGLAVTYFNLGNISFTDPSGNPIRNFTPREVAIAVSGAQKLSDNMGLSVTLRFINSGLIPNSDPSIAGHAANTGSGDVAFYYRKDIKISGKSWNMAYGANLSNLGAKVTYTNSANREFIPTNLKIGTAWTYEADFYNKFTFMLDLNKLLVPSPDSLGRNSSKPYLSGVLGSFTDAPGGFREELREINVSSGIEYWYNNAFAVRAGFFYESPYKGNRHYMTLGVGLHYNNFGFDGAYLIPFQQQNPLAETLRFSLHFNFGKTATVIEEQSIPVDQQAAPN